ncbi:tetratricopeptide repeat protein [Bradyrhizobium sp. 930_D9_N1_4]|uniref:tetratricopeptide repeat protein n=1 Tax=Bradyrhizobium sp. 930_D9_N1_4 TaxID=3240374 RepID=UPI003F8BC724
MDAPALKPTANDLQQLGEAFKGAFKETLALYALKERGQIATAGIAAVTLIFTTQIWMGNRISVPDDDIAIEAPIPTRQAASAVERRERPTSRTLPNPIEDLDRYIAANPDSARARFARGSYYSATNENEKAISDYTAVLHLDPSDLGATLARADAYQKLGAKEQALNDFQRARQIASLAPQESRDMLDFEIKSQDQAITAALIARGDAHRKIGEIPHALADYHAALEISPDNVEALVGRALAYQQDGDLQRALPDYDLAIKIEPTNPLPYLERGQMFKKKGDLTLATNDFRKAVELNPGDAKAYLLLGDLYQGEGRLDEAIASYGRAAEASFGKDQAVALVYRGNAYQAKGNDAAAFADYGAAANVAQEGYLPSRAASAAAASAAR